jgi:hypothetical protein
MHVHAVVILLFSFSSGHHALMNSSVGWRRQVGVCVEREVSGYGGFGLVIYIVYIAANGIRKAVWVTTPKAIVSPLCFVCVRSPIPVIFLVSSGGRRRARDNKCSNTSCSPQLASDACRRWRRRSLDQRTHTHNSTRMLLENTMSLVLPMS